MKEEKDNKVERKETRQNLFIFTKGRESGHYIIIGTERRAVAWGYSLINPLKPKLV
jgi:hypothetical protein